ncbi:MAG TPA: autorepressor SdpR family transcription factor [Roseimicrobium sp.]|nr:autorepressor SdpR family transcription factor [Roseimicrobium sp.]
MNAVYKALADPTRRVILKLLRERDMTAGELADQFPVTKASMSNHFTILKEADLIQGRRDGTTIHYTLNVSVLEEALCGLMETLGVDPTAQRKKAKEKKP